MSFSGVEDFAGPCSVYADSRYYFDNSQHRIDMGIATDAHPLLDQLDQELRYWFFASDDDMKQEEGQIIYFRLAEWTSPANGYPILFQRVHGKARLHPIHNVIYLTEVKHRQFYCSVQTYHLLGLSKFVPLPTCPFK
jgi:hypothetical protein